MTDATCCILSLEIEKLHLKVQPFVESEVFGSAGQDLTPAAQQITEGTHAAQSHPD